MKIINTVTGETVAEIITDHSMSLDEAIGLVGTPYDKQYDDDPDYIIGGMECWYDELAMEW